MTTTRLRYTTDELFTEPRYETRIERDFDIEELGYATASAGEVGGPTPCPLPSRPNRAGP